MRRPIPLLIVLLAAAQPAAHAQFESFVDLEDIKVEKLSNAVRVRIITDGVIQGGIGDFGMFEIDEDTGSWVPRPVTRMSVLLSNARAGVSSTIEVAHYPVSHLEFSVPRDGEGVGLICTIVLYRPARLTAMLTWFDWSRRYYRLYPREPQVTITTSQQRNEIIITATSDRPPVVVPVRPATPDPEPRLELSGHGDDLSLHAVNADLAQTIEAL